MNQTIQWVTENGATLIAIIGAVVVLARLIVKLTPTPRDNEILKKIVNVLKHLGLYIPVVALSLLCLGLQSCAWPNGLTTTGGVAYIFEDGSKARVVAGADKSVQAEYWRKVGDSWVRLETEIKPAEPEVTVEK